MSVLTSNSERLYHHLVEKLHFIAHIRYPHQWRELGWRHGSAPFTIRFRRDGINNKEGLEACIGLILHAAQTLDVPLTKGVSFGFSTSRISSASSMAQGSDPFLRASVGLVMAQIDDLAEAILTGVKRYVAVFDGT
jgi:threonine dehydratase